MNNLFYLMQSYIDSGQFSFNLDFFNGNYLSDLLSLYIYIFSIFFLVFFLLVVSLILSNSILTKMVSLKNSSYECGFTPIYSNVSSKFYLSFFQVGAIFLIFDLEVLYIFPIMVILKSYFLNGILYIYIYFILLFIIIFLGVIYEYCSGILDWK